MGSSTGMAVSLTREAGLQPPFEWKPDLILIGWTSVALFSHPTLSFDLVWKLPLLLDNDLKREDLQECTVLP